jgi:hypothetical protein
MLLLSSIVVSCESLLTSNDINAADCHGVGPYGPAGNDGCKPMQASVNPKLSPESRYPGPWVEVTQDIRDILDRNKVRACAQAMGRQSANDPGEYLLYCTRDEQRWTRWRVWPTKGKVRGPDEIFAAMSLPDGY